MSRARAAAGSIVFLLLAPGLTVGVVPWLLTGWESTGPPLALAVLGGLLTAAGGAVVMSAFARFVLEGLGTPAPVAPPERLVTRPQSSAPSSRRIRRRIASEDAYVESIP